MVDFFFFSSRRRHTRCSRDWSSDVCSSDLWGVSNQYVAMARAIEAATESFWGRRIYLNGPGAVGAICLDLGFDTELIKGVFLLSRTVSLVAHTYEEAHREKGWRGSANASIVQPLDLSLQRPEFYDGPADRPLPGRPIKARSGAKVNRKGG